MDHDAAQHWAKGEKVKLWEVSVADRRTLIEPFIYLASKMTQPQSKSAFPLSRKNKGSGSVDGCASACSSHAASCPSPLSFPCTYLLPSLLGAVEPAGSLVARGVGFPGLGMVFEEERGDPSPCTDTRAVFTAQESPSAPLCPRGSG